jgi:hypothetical protein
MGVVPPSNILCRFLGLQVERDNPRPGRFRSNILLHRLKRPRLLLPLLFVKQGKGNLSK